MESFSQRIKSELLELPIESYKSMCYELCALLMFSGTKENENTFFLPHNDAASTHRILKLIEIAQKYMPQSKKITIKYLLNSVPKQKTVCIPCKLQDLKNAIIPELMVPAFLRGIFLSCGNISNPETEYHLEFCCPTSELSDILIKILSENQNLNFEPKFVFRRNSYVIYSKNGDKITDLLVYIGAKNHAMDLMQIKMLKEVRNNINRTTNFETANISKITNSATYQISAIKKLKKSKKFEFLPDTLKEIANLRLENPYSSLQDLSDMCGGKISKSGINHRLKKLIEISKEPA